MFKLLQYKTCTGVSKIDEDRCKQTLASVTLFWGVQVVSIYRYNEPTIILHMHVVSPVYQKYRITSLRCIFETSVYIYTFKAKMMLKV